MDRVRPLKEELLEEIEKSKAEVAKWVAQQRREAEKLNEQHQRAKGQKEGNISCWIHVHFSAFRSET